MMQKEKYNQEEGFNPKMSLRLGSPILTTSPTDHECPIMFTDSCSMCGSRKRRCLTPSFEPTKKTILIDPTSIKEPENGSAHRNSPKISPSFLNQIPNPTFVTSPSLRRSVSDLVNSPSSFALPGPFNSPKSPENVAATSNQISSPSNPYFGRSSSFSGCFDAPKSNPPEITPSSSKPSLQLPKSPSTESLAIGDRKDPNCCPSSSSGGGTCKLSVGAATIDHSNDEKFEENSKKVQFCCSCGKNYEVSFFD